MFFSVQHDCYVSSFLIAFFAPVGGAANTTPDPAGTAEFIVGAMDGVGTGGIESGVGDSDVVGGTGGGIGEDDDNVGRDKSGSTDSVVGIEAEAAGGFFSSEVAVSVGEAIKLNAL